MLYQDPNHNAKSQRDNILLYAAFALCVVIIFWYVIFSFKGTVENKKTALWVSRKAAISALPDAKAAEKKILDTQKKLADYRLVLANHRVVSHIFSFIEERTMPAVWFSNFDMSQQTHEVKLTGEAQDMATVSRQVKLFEESRHYVTSATIINTVTQPSRKVMFTMSIVFHPVVFTPLFVPEPLKIPS